MNQTKRVFLAIELSETIKQKIHLLKNELIELNNGLKFVEARNQHLTLVFFGEQTIQQVGKIIESLSGLSEKKFELTAAGIGCFPSLDNPRVLWAGMDSSELTELQKKIEEKLSLKIEKEFIGHATIARIKQLNQTQTDILREFVKKHEKDFFGKQSVEEIFLLESKLTKDGPVYAKLFEKKLV